MQKVLKLWGEIYRGFVWERFDKFSKGGGNWKPLSARTIRGRRIVKGVGSVAMILRDTNVMMNALEARFKGAPGAVQILDLSEQSIIVGFGGTAPHKSTGGRLTVADLATIHQIGNSRLPARKMIVDPSANATKVMVRVLEQQLDKDVDG